MTVKLNPNPLQFRHPTNPTGPQGIAIGEMDPTAKTPPPIFRFENGRLHHVDRHHHQEHHHHCWDSLPPPSVSESSPPAGVGISKAPEFGPNAVRTAGGYVVVAEGKDMAWSVYSPGQKPGETPTTRVWGDPHVNESDGTRWDFSKNSNFRLPDGTNITCTTTKQEGQSLTSSIDISNGQDRVKMGGIDKNQPQVGEITHDGYYARAELDDKADTFLLGGDSKHVEWFRERNGVIEGEVTGAQLTTKDGEQVYEQNVNKDVKYVVDPGLRPKPGTEAWGNQVRDEAMDILRGLFGKGSLLTEVGAALITNGDQNQQDLQAAEKKAQPFFDQLDQLCKLFSFMTMSAPKRALSNSVI